MVSGLGFSLGLSWKVSLVSGIYAGVLGLKGGVTEAGLVVLVWLECSYYP